MENWRKDIKSLTPYNTGNVWDVCVLSDGRIIVLVDSPLPYVTLMAFNADGSTATVPLATRADQQYDVRRMVAVGNHAVLQPLGWVIGGGADVMDNNEAGAARGSSIIYGPGAWGLQTYYPTVVQCNVDPVTIVHPLVPYTYEAPAQIWRDFGFSWGFRATSAGARVRHEDSADCPGHCRGSVFGGSLVCDRDQPSRVGGYRQRRSDGRWFPDDQALRRRGRSEGLGTPSSAGYGHRPDGFRGCRERRGAAVCEGRRELCLSTA